MKRSMTALALAAALGSIGSNILAAQEAAITTDGDRVTFINVLTPNEGVTLDALARQLTVAMENDASTMPGFQSASVHVARDKSYVVNYAQWDNVASVEAVIVALGEGRLPDLARAFAMSSPEFHPYDVQSVTLAGDQ